MSAQVINIIAKVKAWVDAHRSFIDYTVIGGAGLGHGIKHYWEHFWSEDNITKLLDGCFGTLCYTIIGLVITYIFHRVTKMKKV